MNVTRLHKQSGPLDSRWSITGHSKTCRACVPKITSGTLPRYPEHHIKPLCSPHTCTLPYQCFPVAGQFLAELLPAHLPSAPASSTLSSHDAAPEAHASTATHATCICSCVRAPLLAMLRCCAGPCTLHGAPATPRAGKPAHSSAPPHSRSRPSASASAPKAPPGSCTCRSTST